MRRGAKLSLWVPAVALLLLSAYAHHTAAQSSAYTPPRTPHGDPDLEGVWRVWNLAGYDLEPHAASHETPAGLGVIVDPADRLIPYKPWARARRDENFKASRITYPWDPVKGPDPLGRCYLPGVPRITYLGYPFQIIQEPGLVVMLYEWNHVKREIPLHNRERLRGAEYFNGIPRGRFEGSTLVVDITNLSDATWLDKAGNFYTRTAHVVERYTPIGPNELQYEVTIEDPRVYTRPWTIRMPIQRQTDARLLEYECVELLEQAGRPPIWERDWDKLIPVPND